MAVRSPQGPAPSTRHWGGGPGQMRGGSRAELHTFDKRQATETRTGFVLQVLQACFQEAQVFHF